MSMIDPKTERGALMWHEDDPDTYIWVTERPRPTGPRWGAIKAQRKRDSGLDEHV